MSVVKKFRLKLFVLMMLWAAAGCTENTVIPVLPPAPEPPQTGKNIAALKLHEVLKNDEKLLLRNDRHTLTLNAGKQRCTIDTIPVFLNDTVTFADNQWQLAENSTENFLRPILEDRCKPIRTILLDPGHGGRDTGAISVKKDLEKELNLLLAKAIGGELEKAGFTVCYTRKDDSYLSLDERPALIAEYKADLFISIHHNAAANPNARGHEVFVFRGETPEEHLKTAGSIGYAFAVEYALSRLPGNHTRGVKSARFKVLRLAESPAILIEAAFLSSQEDAALAANAAARQAFAEAVAAGLRSCAAK